MKTDEKWRCIRQAAQHRRRTAAFLCRRVKAQLTQLAERRYRLQESLTRLRKLNRAGRGAPAQHDRETAALINILQRMSVNSQS